MGDLDLVLGDQRPRDLGAEQVGAFIEGIGAKHRKDEIAHELLAQIVDKDLADAEQLGLAARRPELLALAEISSKVRDGGSLANSEPAVAAILLAGRAASPPVS